MPTSRRPSGRGCAAGATPAGLLLEPPNDMDDLAFFSAGTLAGSAFLTLAWVSPALVRLPRRHLGFGGKIAFGAKRRPPPSRTFPHAPGRELGTALSS